MKTKLYVNRYGDTHKFTPTEDGHILWEGKFQWCRFGFPNVYDDAYRRYQEDGGTESMIVFTKLVHEWDDEKSTYTDLAKKYGQYVYSDRDTIDMVDPSGGPYLSRGTASELIHPDVKGKKVDQFLCLEEGYKIILK